jgi:hypothetical protein
MTHSNSDKIGWGHPPVHHRFRKGQSGNPRGRPRRSKRVEDAILKVLNRKVRFGEKRVTIAEALINGLRRETMDGNRRAMKLSELIIASADQALPPPPPPLTKKQEEQQIQKFLEGLNVTRERLLRYEHLDKERNGQ